jgi:A/G-specific adenine glycosylase
MRKGSKDALKEISQQAVQWYRAHKRDLPWRRTRNPYHIWISECMLQQTQVVTVIPYFEKFLKRFPNVEALASADLDTVYQYWAGLGYYRRARQLHAAAQQVVASNATPFPQSVEKILLLPGVGKYTAHAIGSFAFDAPCGIVEANTQRLYARLIACSTPLANSATQKILWDYATSLVHAWALPSGELNQALMELGSQVCKPKDPACNRCPLTSHCLAYKLKQTDSIPAPKEKKIITPLKETALLIQDCQQRWLLRRCKPKERWAGLWDFPRYDTTECNDERQSIEHALTSFHTLYGIELVRIRPATQLQHTVTRYKITLNSYQASLPDKVTEPKNSKGTDELAWHTLAELRKVALSSSGRKLCKWLESTST